MVLSSIKRGDAEKVGGLYLSSGPHGAVVLDSGNACSLPRTSGRADIPDTNIDVAVTGTPVHDLYDIWICIIRTVPNL